MRGAVHRDRSSSQSGVEEDNDTKAHGGCRARPTTRSIAGRRSIAGDTRSILLDMNPDVKLAERLRAAVEGKGDQLTDLYLLRVGHGHLAAIVGVTKRRHDVDYYRRELSRYKKLSHATLEISSL